nr:hypothetical protein CFP56_03804 [Quercus suber]
MYSTCSSSARAYSARGGNDCRHIRLSSLKLMNPGVALYHPSSLITDPTVTPGPGLPTYGGFLTLSHTDKVGFPIHRPATLCGMVVRSSEVRRALHIAIIRYSTMLAFSKIHPQQPMKSESIWLRPSGRQSLWGRTCPA